MGKLAQSSGVTNSILQPLSPPLGVIPEFSNGSNLGREIDGCVRFSRRVGSAGAMPDVTGEPVLTQMTAASNTASTYQDGFSSGPPIKLKR